VPFVGDPVEDLGRRGEEGVHQLANVLAAITFAIPALLALSAVNWAYTWLRPGVATDPIADGFYALLVDGMRGYSTPGA
jgi:hypothetical protein